VADVQLKNGYIRIAAELLDQFFIRDFSIVQLRILLLLLRYSYGCRKKTAKIKPQSLFSLAYVYDSDIKRELRHLERNSVIACNFEEKIFAINKNYDEWKIPYHKLFDEEKYAKLLHINLSCELIKKLGGNKDFKKEENKSLLPPNKNLSCHLIKKLGGNKETQPENTSPERVLSTSTNSIQIVTDNKDIYINNNKEQKTQKAEDPYFGSLTSEFKKEFEKVFKKTCYLNNFQCQKLVEIPETIPNFRELIPVLLEKFSKITFNFKGEITKPGLRWLLEEGNYADVLSGKFDVPEKEPEQQQAELPDSAYDL